MAIAASPGAGASGAVAAAEIRAYPGSTSQGHVAEIVLTGRRVDWFMQARVSCSDGRSLNETLETDRSDQVSLRRDGRFSEHGRAPTASGGGTVTLGIVGRLRGRSGSGTFFAHYRYPSGLTCTSQSLRWRVRYQPTVHSYWLS